MRIHSRDEGAALVEFAVIAIVMFTILFGIIEMGLALRDWLSVTSSSREGARVAAAAGNDPDADCAILNAATGPLLALGANTDLAVWIYDASTGSFNPGIAQHYVPDTGTPSPLNCDTSWERVANGYPPGARNVAANNLGTVGIRVQFCHVWLTGFFPYGSSCSGGDGTLWADDAIMRIEPKSFSGP